LCSLLRRAWRINNLRIGYNFVIVKEGDTDYNIWTYERQRENTTRACKKLNEELRNLYSSRDISKTDNIKTDLKYTECKDVDWSDLDQDRAHWWAVVKTVMNLSVK
jgi:hypothetical protein